MKMRPEAEQKLRAGFQRRVDEHAQRYAEQLAHAAQLAARFGCGEVTGVFSMEAGGDPRPRTYVLALLPPLAGIPLLIGAAAAGVRGLMPLFIGFPFAAGAWIGLNFLLGRKPKRRVWFYAFTDGFMVLTDPPVDAAAVGPGQSNTVLAEPAAAACAASAKKALEVLTDREREVLVLVARGMSNAEIANHLTISPATAKTHVAHLLTKLDARDRIQLVILAYQSGLTAVQ